MSSVLIMAADHYKLSSVGFNTVLHIINGRNEQIVYKNPPNKISCILHREGKRVSFTQKTKWIEEDTTVIPKKKV